MNKSEKTSQKLLDSIRKTKASEGGSSSGESKTEASPPPAAKASEQEKKTEKKTEVSVQRMPSSRRVWPD